MLTGLNARVQALLERWSASGEEAGLQVAAYVDGETLVTSWSTTKGFVATCLPILADRGGVAYDASVATYWPGFAANGKEAITVRHVLTHTAGLPHMLWKTGRPTPVRR